LPGLLDDRGHVDANDVFGPGTNGEPW
jgi:hypothetical protein